MSVDDNAIFSRLQKIAATPLSDAEFGALTRFVAGTETSEDREALICAADGVIRAQT